MRPEHLILHERHVRRQHHQAFRLEILVLLRPIPLLPAPLLVQEQAEIVIGDHGRREGPGPVEPGAVGMAPPQRVRAAQRHNLAVVEAHAPKDRAEVVLSLGAVGQAAVGGAEADVAVRPPRPPGDGGALHLLDRRRTGQRPQIRVRDPRELCFDWLEEVAGGFQPCVRAVVAFGGEPHRGTVGAAGVGGDVVGAGAVPGKTHDDGAVGAVVVVGVLF